MMSQSLKENQLGTKFLCINGSLTNFSGIAFIEGFIPAFLIMLWTIFSNLAIPLTLGLASVTLEVLEWQNIVMQQRHVSVPLNMNIYRLLRRRKIKRIQISINLLAAQYAVFNSALTSAIAVTIFKLRKIILSFILRTIQNHGCIFGFNKSLKYLYTHVQNQWLTLSSSQMHLLEFSLRNVWQTSLLYWDWRDSFHDVSERSISLFKTLPAFDSALQKRHNKIPISANLGYYQLWSILWINYFEKYWEGRVTEGKCKAELDSRWVFHYFSNLIFEDILN